MWTTALSAQSAIADVLSHPADAGAGSGGTADAGSGGTPYSGGGGSAGSQGQGQGAGSGGGTSYHLTDDSMVHFGDGKAVRWADHKSSLMPREEYDRGVNFLMKVAESFDQRGGGQRQGQQGQPRQGQQGQGQGQYPRGQQQQQQGQQRQAARDPFEGLEDQAVVDGRTVAKIGRQLVQEGLAPLGQAMQQIGAKMEAMEGRLAKAEGAAGAWGEQQANGEFERHIDGVLAKVPEIKGLGVIDPKSDIVREIARDIWLSHDQKDPTLMREFPKMVEQRLTQLFSAFTKMQQSFVQQSQQKQRQFFNPNKGSATGTGDGEYRHMTGKDIAAMAKESGMFGPTHTT